MEYAIYTNGPACEAYISISDDEKEWPWNVGHFSLDRVLYTREAAEKRLQEWEDFWRDCMKVS